MTFDISDSKIKTHAYALLIHYVFVYLYLDQNDKLSITSKSYILDIVRFLDLPQLNVHIPLEANVYFV